MKRPVLATVLVGTLALAGCAQAGSTAAPGPASSSPTQVSPPPSRPSPGETLPPTPIAGCTGTVPTAPVVISDQDNNRAFCVPTGTHVEIYLHGTADDKWSAPVTDNDVLRPEASGKGALMVGVSAAFYVADHAGQARVTATRDGARYEIVVRVV